MDIFGILTMIGGLSLFLYGMTTMGDGLVMLSGGRLEKILEKLTNTRIMALLLGTVVTAVIQSSSATTVMVVGFVNSGIMSLNRAVGVIMGANIGTTVTSWILSLTGIQGSSIFVKLLKPSSFSPVLAAIGIVMLMTGKDGTKKKNIGSILLGFAVLMFGMETMSGAVAPLRDNEAFTGILTAFSNPLLGMLAGAVLTAVIQSSSASVGILQALCVTGAVSFGSAVPIIMGQNIGTCATALISSIGANKNARRASLIHLYFNLIGTVLFMTVFYMLDAVIGFSFMDTPANAAGIAVVHSLFNISCAIVLLPFAGGLVKLSELTIRDEEEGEPAETPKPAALAALDDRFLESPAFAVQLCKNAVDEMAKISAGAFKKAIGTAENYSESICDEVISLEQQADMFEDVLGTYMVRLAGKELSKEDSRTLSILLHCINDFERISDHAVNIIESIQEMHSKKLSLTETGKKEFISFGNTVSDIMELTTTVFLTDDRLLAKNVEPLEEVIDTLSIEMKQRHIQRLRKGICSLETGIILEDLITNLERISDHCSNIAVCIIEIHEGEFVTHGYIDELTVKGKDTWFSGEYARLREKYALPKPAAETAETEKMVIK
ncbi:MAG: Na/Pi cotransporter family protein [Eubacteriales bacterium]|nr:Na/Pi cotransporter family protein [Eubacteriales bacterium]